ncbi:MAG: class I SAM-dependent methyltransferase [Anaerolineales bacterium]|nr:class I SAM-dependent methyltransferase [Anaerolineales bacterium]
MTDFQEIYRSHSDMYEQMVLREDYQGHILPQLQKIVPIEDANVVELGAGTGRITDLLLPHVRHITALDQSAAMLRVAANKLRQTGWSNWPLGVADNRHLPLVSETADFAVAGWSLAHSVGWYPDSWQAEIGLMLSEMTRMVKPGGVVLLLETLGTGRATPEPPSPHLARYYDWLETVHGFERAWIRTDYQFTSPEEGAALTRFFFGDELADRILAQQMTVLPECTGVWWQQRIGK